MPVSKIEIGNPRISSIYSNKTSIAPFSYPICDNAPATSHGQVQLARASTITDVAIVNLVI